jgi:hypothetical protein
MMAVLHHRGTRKPKVLAVQQYSHHRGARKPNNIFEGTLLFTRFLKGEICEGWGQNISCEGSAHFH